MSDRSVLWSNDAHAARGALETLLTECQGNVTLASRRAGIERQSMHRLLKRHGLSARDFRPRGGGSIIARAALKNLDQQLAPPARTAPRDFTRAVIREAAEGRGAEVLGVGVTVTHPTPTEQLPAHERAAAYAAIAATTASRDHAAPTRRTPASATRSAPPALDPLHAPALDPLHAPALDPLHAPALDPLHAPASAAPASAAPPARSASSTSEHRRDRASLASPSFERAAGPPRRPTEPLIERPVTPGELADRAFDRRRPASPHHRPYQSPLGAAALAALALRKSAAG